MPEDMTPEERIDFDERAAIAYYCGGLSKDDAEALALQEILGRRICPLIKNTPKTAYKAF